MHLITVSKHVPLANALHNTVNPQINAILCFVTVCAI